MRGRLRRFVAGTGKVKNCAAYGVGFTLRHVIPNWELHSYLWEPIGSHRKQSSCGRTGTNGFRRGVVGRSARKRVDPSRVARKSGIRSADTNARGVRCLSGLCSVSVRLLSEL